MPSSTRSSGRWACTCSTARTRIERDFRPEEIRALKSAATTDIGIGGPTIAAVALRAGLVDEIGLLLCPIVIGGGLPALPDGLRLPLVLLEERSFRSGVAYLRYEVKRA